MKVFTFFLLLCSSSIFEVRYSTVHTLVFLLLNECACTQDAVTICTLGIGTAFGESILDNTPRHATIVSRETSELLRIEQREFKSLWEVRKEATSVTYSQRNMKQIFIAYLNVS